MRARVGGGHDRKAGFCVNNEIDFFCITEAINLSPRYQSRGSACPRAKLSLTAYEIIPPNRRDGWCRLAESSTRKPAFVSYILHWSIGAVDAFASWNLSQIFEATHTQRKPRGLVAGLTLRSVGRCLSDRLKRAGKIQRDRLVSMQLTLPNGLAIGKQDCLRRIEEGPMDSPSIAEQAERP